MATKADLATRLQRRFKGVPNFTLSDAEELVDESLNIHGYEGLDASADIPRKDETVILLYAQAQGARQIAMSVAHYFRFSDGEESVDKSMVAENYLRLARIFQEDYDRERGKMLGNNFRLMKRLDRPITQPPSGLSKYGWRRK